MKKPDKKILNDFQALVDSDTAFSAYARVLQSKWRLDNRIPIGTYKKKERKHGSTTFVPLGNFIDNQYSDIAFENEEGGNFLSSNIWKVVKSTIANKEKGAKIEINRLYRNLLSSQPLAFNLFGELSLDLGLASKFFSDLFPERIKEVTEIIFEHSPGRGDHTYTSDSSAFDVFVKYLSPTQKKGFTGIEVKYAESLRDEPSSHKPRYEEISNKSGLFNLNSIVDLQKKPIQQIWRDHLLSLSVLNHSEKKYDEGFFIYLYPKQNKQCDIGVDKYLKTFNAYDSITNKVNEAETGFYPRYLKNFMLKLQDLLPGNYTNELLQRYFGDEKYDVEIRG